MELGQLFLALDPPLGKLEVRIKKDEGRIGVPPPLKLPSSLTFRRDERAGPAFVRLRHGKQIIERILRFCFQRDMACDELAQVQLAAGMVDVDPD